MDWKKIRKALLFPPAWLIAVLILVSGAALTAVFVCSYEESPIAYAVYVLAFYTLSVVCLFCWKMLPEKYQQVKEKALALPLVDRYRTDGALRSKVSLYTSLGISLLYVGINLLNLYWSRSWWFVVLAGYYMIMAVLRFLLVRYVRKKRIGTEILAEWRRSRLCACILLLVNLSLSGAVLMILYQNKGYSYPGIMIYVMSAYTFYATIHAIIDIVKYRSLGSPVMSTVKIVSLSAALVSMLNLETAMFAQFGADMPLDQQHLLIILTGGGISISVVILSVLLIVSATKEIRRNKDGE